ncbi:MAG: DUF4912 domain-containing protein [Chroococcidiopsidaceae cyanobacterium CP_BM_ER_R8_30]|nr:DUF4912 domain-containing protein [Chroococcidiopsidaceae cyanobacterium CP_BM_ER_R8_30]
MKKAHQAFHHKHSSAASLAVLLALVLAPTDVVAPQITRSATASQLRSVLLAQAANPTFPFLSSVPKGTSVKINSSNSAAKVIDGLKEGFQKRFPDASFNVDFNGSDTALKNVANGSADVAAVGRSLTAAEKNQGLVSVPIKRSKIAMIVGKDNPFQGSLTDEQFARMFRGEITNWSQVGGPSKPIRFIDQPDTSDTRKSLRNYPVFKEAPFQSGSTTVKADNDTIDAVAKKLGNDGIGYAIVDEAVARPDVRIISMHGTQPTDPRYPFSQPLLYAYKGPNPSPGAQAFLGYATNPEQAAAPQAPAQTQAASPSPPAPTTAATPQATERTGGGFPWWWLLAIPVLGGLAWWLLRGRGTPAETIPPAVAPRPTAVTAPPALESRIILTPRNCREGYAYWEVPDSVTNRRGSEPLKLRLYDVTDIDLDRQSPHSVKEFNCRENERDLHIPIEQDNRDYLVELGYLNANGDWQRIARSEHVRVPACQPGDPGLRTIDNTVHRDRQLFGAPAMAGAAAVGAVRSRLTPKEESRIILTPRNSKAAYAYWEVPEEAKAEAKRQGGRNLALRVHDTTGLDADARQPHSLQQYNCDESQQDLHVPIPVANRDYVAELGYVGDRGEWLKLARSQPVHVPATLDAKVQDAPSQI